MASSEENLILSAIKILTAELHLNSLDKGFWDEEDALLEKCHENTKLYRRVKQLFNAEKIALMHSELSEGLEGCRKDGEILDTHCPDFLNIEIEMADAIIRILEFCQRRNFRIGDALIAKHNFNLTRERMHGKNS
jgi:hypothetical protein